MEHSPSRLIFTDPPHERFDRPLTIMSSENRPTPSIPAKAPSPDEARLTRRSPDLGRYAAAIAAVAVALAGAFIVGPVAGTENVDLLFLVFIIGVAIRLGLGPSLVASLLSLLAYNFFFMTPVHTFEVADPTNVAALFFFTAVALITSHLAARARNQAIAAKERAREAEALYRFSRQVSELVELDALARATLQQVTSMLSLRGVLVLRDRQGEAQVTMPEDSSEPVNPIDLAAVQASWSRVPDSLDVLRLGNRLYFPLQTSQGVLGSLGVQRDWTREPLAREERQFLAALADQAAVAIERVRLAVERDEARLTTERERLRSTLFASLSHDLKTPLASITGAITSLRQYGDLYDPDARDELAATVQEEAERLSRFVGNLLDMARLEAGGVAPNLQPADLGEMIGAALQRTETLLEGFDVQVAVEPELPMLRLDPVLFEQVLVNLLDNAAKYAPARSTVALDARLDGEAVLLTVTDDGPGIPPTDLTRIFDKFYRSDAGDRQSAGTGLGLAICRGFVTAMGGTISAANRPPPASGTIFAIRLPSTIFAAALPREDAAK